MSVENENIDNINDNNSNRNNETDIHPENCYTQTTVTNLTEGVLEIYQPHLKKVQSQLHELNTKQKVLVEQLHNENLKLAWSQNSAEYQEMFKKIQHYRDKLINIKKEMKSLHERSTKLKKRAVRIQQLKEKEEVVKAQRRQREQDLIGCRTSFYQSIQLKNFVNQPSNSGSHIIKGI